MMKKEAETIIGNVQKAAYIINREKDLLFSVKRLCMFDNKPLNDNVDFIMIGVHVSPRFDGNIDSISGFYAAHKDLTEIQIQMERNYVLRRLQCASDKKLMILDLDKEFRKINEYYVKEIEITQEEDSFDLS